MIIDSYQRGSENAISDFENKIGFKIPIDYRSFLLQSDGAKINDGVLWIKDLGKEVLMDTLYGINTNHKELSIGFWINEFKDDIPEQSLLIGDDAGGGLILFVTSKENYGIYYWDHSYAFDKSSDEGNTYFIADSFTNFMQKLK